MSFFKKNFSIIILILSIILLAYVFYRSELYWNGSKRDFYKIYYFLSVILILISVLSFYLKNHFKGYFIISFVSLILGIYLVEGYLTFYHNQKIDKKELSFKIQAYSDKADKVYDTRSRLEFYKDQKKIDNQIKIVFLSSHLKLKNNDFLPLSGVSNSKTINCNENGYYSIYDSDRYGFNNPDYEWDQKEIEYLLIGDSFTHGSCVNRPNDFASVLRSLTKKSVLNLGYRGNGPVAEYASLREYMPSNVKKILWFYFEGNDIENMNDEIKHKTFQKYFKDLNFSQNLKNKQDEVDDFVNLSIKNSFEKNENDSLIQTKIIKFVKFFELRLLINRIINQKTVIDNFNKSKEIKELFYKINKLATNNNSELYIIYLPEYSRYVSEGGGGVENSDYNLIKGVLEELDLNLIDINEELFAKINDPLIFFPFGLNGHYNELGNRKIAELIFKKTKGK